MPYAKDRFGFYIRVPVGIIAAITPFNFPLNLVAHKVAPAIASANSVILKPASYTPLTAILLVKTLLEAGLPKNAINLITGPGGKIGDKLVTHPEIRMITFTGSLEVGEKITKLAGLKKLTMELGSNSACIVDKDADLELASKRIIVGAFSVAGQVCISVQRVFIHSSGMNKFLKIFIPFVKQLKLGDQLLEETDVGPMITPEAAKKTKQWIDEAKTKILCGGNHKGSLFEPTVLVDVDEKAKIYSEEAFAPVVIVNKFDKFDEAIELVNHSKYGLQAGIFTADLNKAMEALKKIEVGGVIVNDVPTFRADVMPYGGVKSSGLGREGPKFAIEEMTELKAVCFKV